MKNEDMRQQILFITSQYTNIIPEVLFREGYNNVLVIWQGTIPSKEIAAEIRVALANTFGLLLTNHCREVKLVSFIISI